MPRYAFSFIFLLFFFFYAISCLNAQPPEVEKDTFFLAKKRGLLGQLGQQISRDPIIQYVNNSNPFKRYSGKVISSIEIVGLGLKQDLMDTFDIHPGFVTGLADRFHRDTRESVIRKNLFFKVGDRLMPLLMTDNDRFLREQAFLKDALIIPMNNMNNNDSVDIVIIAWDVFSIGGSASANTDYGIVTVSEENLYGRGARGAVSAIFDVNRRPRFGLGVDYLERNIGGLFFDWNVGLTTFNNSISSNKYEEFSFYSAIEKPLVNRYTEWTGGFGLFLNRTRNDYQHTDSFYLSDVKYNNVKVDLWGGYNFGWRSNRSTDSEKRFRYFLSGRAFFAQFQEKPQKYNDVYNFDYADLNGFLLSYSMYRQNYQRANFIYGFGRNEDVPSGANFTCTSGWTDKENVGRVYLGMEGNWNIYKKKGDFFAPYIKASGYFNKGNFQDVELMAGVEMFTKLRLINANWLNRNFFNASLGKQFDRTFNRPLYVRSSFGLPYFRNDSLASGSRITLRFESVFINLKKIFGFRLAPFCFTDFCSLYNSRVFDNYPAFGGGVRTRNENLIFGTIELRGYYFPKVALGMDRWRVEVRSNLKFKFSSQFVKKPDFQNYN